ncbi:hypothetical protein V2J09_003146 [Rumex salicifolius]
MTKPLIFFLVILSVGRAQAQAHHTWAKTVNSGKEKTTTLQFYFHDVLSGKSPSAIPVAHPDSTGKYLTGFGTLMMADDALTIGPDPNSKLVGRAQGLYGSACRDDLALIMAMSYSFVDGAYNGSSISIMGRNWAAHPVREIPVVGGTGVFRMARGYAVATTHTLNAGSAIIGYNVTIVH